MTSVLVDTGALYAIYDRRDRWHGLMVEALADADLVLPAPILPEVDHLLGRWLGFEAQLSFYDSLAAGEFDLVELSPRGYSAIRQLNQKFADLRLGFVDASIVVLAEEIGLRNVATVDRRHFEPLARAFDLELIPDRVPEKR